MCQYIFAKCPRFAHNLLINLSSSIEDFVDFLKEHLSTFIFSSQEQPLTSPKPL